MPGRPGLPPSAPLPAAAADASARRARAIEGSLLGAAVGDAIALPFEGLSRRRVGRMWTGGRLRHRLLAGRGLCSDDTEHACMVAQSLLAAGDDQDLPGFVTRFRASLAWRLRWWLCGLPAGIGMATLRAIVLLWCNPFRSGDGVDSAGNGPAMRSAIIGATLGRHGGAMPAIVAASTRLTHTDPRAEQGALAVALAAAIAAESGDPATHRESFVAAVQQHPELAAGPLAAAIAEAAASAARGEATEVFAAAIGCANGVTGFVLHTVPVALHAWLRHPGDYAGAIEAVVRCGGDTDTVAAIVGGIVGAGVGRAGIPAAWLDGVAEWPHGRAWMRRLAGRLAGRFAGGSRQAPLPYDPARLVLRNAVFMVVVLAHGFRRLLPPY